MGICLKVKGKQEHSIGGTIFPFINRISNWNKVNNELLQTQNYFRDKQIYRLDFKN